MNKEPTEQRRMFSRNTEQEGQYDHIVHIHETRPLDIEEWARWVETAYDEKWWARLSTDINHYKIVERIGQPLRVKLLYDSYLWRWLLDGREIDNSQQVVELLPGWSHTIAVALESLGFSGTLAQVDLQLPDANRTPFPYERVWVNQNILDCNDNFEQASFILGNHILDDLLICQANSTENARTEYYSSPTFSRDVWANLAQAPMLDSWVEKTGACISGIAAELSKDQALILREYPSTIATRQGDTNRWALERMVQEVIFDQLAVLRRINAERVDISHAPVPPGSRFPDSIVVVTKK